MRGFSDNPIDLMYLVKLLSNNVFFQGKELGYMYQFRNKPFQNEIFSSSLDCGAFHTDFWSLDNTPNYIMIQCIKTDPKHPYYSRNQVASVGGLLSILEKLFPNISKNINDMYLPHLKNNRILWVKLLEDAGVRKAIRIHPKYIVENQLKPIHYIDGIPIHRLISDVAQSISHDFVLDISDILIVSNKFCLHRRGEATVAFDHASTQWLGREVNTLRFF